MHVLLIHQAFASPNNPGGTRHYELASSLVAQGHRVTVITSAVNYLTGGHGEASEAGLPAGLRIVRVRGTSDIHRSYWERGKAFMRFGASALREALRVKDVDVIWGTSPPLVQLLPAWLASLRCPGGLVFEERDLWPEFAIGMGVVRNGWLARGALAFKRFMYRRARAIVINSPGFLDFVRGYGVPAEKVHVIPNGVDISQFDPQAKAAEVRKEWGADGRFVVLYAGALGPANALEIVLDAAELLRDTPVLFLLVGDGKARPDLMRAAQERGLENVRFVPAQPKRLMPPMIAAADACLATLRDIPLFRTTYPNKVFDYMAGGRAVLLGIDGVIRDVVERARAGLFVSPGQGHALATAVRRLMQDPVETRAMGLRGRAAACDSFDRRLQAVQIEALFRGLLDGRQAAGDAPPSDPHGRRRPDGARGEARGVTSVVTRALDLGLAAALLVALSPVLVAVALAVRLLLGSPVLFRQQRTGLLGRAFTLYKFRTMAPAPAGTPDGARLGRLGHLFRSLSVDELPQLWNVLCGDMAMVGPRPLLPAYLDRYTPEQDRRHEVRPGITGLAQVSGRNGLSWPQKFALDVWYVDHRSLAINLWILWRTAVALLRGDGIRAPGCATMPEFVGESRDDRFGVASTRGSCDTS